MKMLGLQNTVNILAKISKVFLYGNGAEKFFSESGQILKKKTFFK